MNGIYFIRTLTNMHIGDGQANYGIIDNLVQRDVLTEFPIIHSSSLKGALKQYCEFQLSQESAENSEEKNNLVDYIFGSDKMSGAYRFFDANLLCIPVRSITKPYYLATCPKIIESFLDLSDFLGINISFKDDLLRIISATNKDDIKGFSFVNQPNDSSTLKIEDIPVCVQEFEFSRETEKENFEKYFGALDNFVVFTNNAFCTYVKDLPVIARNKLENGLSVNLWYEEIVPRESRFYFGLLSDSRFQNQFCSLLSKQPIQIGANASIGYGYSKIYASLPSGKGESIK